MDIDVAIIAVVFLGLAVFGNMIFLNKTNPITVFCGIWSLILLAYSLHAYGLYEASSYSILLIGVGVIMFFIGALVATAINIKRRPSILSRGCFVENDTVCPNYVLLFLLNSISFAFLVGFGVTTIRMLLSGHSFYYIHNLYNDEMGTIGASRTYQNIFTWYVWPLMDASLATLAVVIQVDREENKFKKWAIVLIIINLALFTLITGKRAHLGYIVVYMIAVYLMQGKRIQLKRKTKFEIFVGLLVVLWAFQQISTSRGSVSLIRSIYIYFTGCIPHLSIKLDGFSSQIQLKGIASIYGLYQAPLIILNTFFRSSFLLNIRYSMSQLIAVTQQRVTIAPGITFNAFLTPFFYFYADGGMIGNIVLSFIFGYIAMLVYINHLNKHSYKSMILYLLVFFTLYMSMVRIQFFQMRFTLSFMYVYIIFMKSRIKIVLKSNKKQT